LCYKRHSAECAIEENLAALLYMRDIKTPAEIYRFLYPSMSDLHSPFLMSGVREAVLRIKQAISKKEKIVYLQILICME
jgi:single-stranded-DNA-specific exonuclease